ncbi:MAG: hypothetical protein M1812_005957 [Candelaria pacifica]|nr:MAG: hypothetical protein M1812_005957 [Candelaria pacifica]
MASNPVEGVKVLGSIPPPKHVATTSRWPNPRDIPAVLDNGSKPPFSYVELIGMAVIRSASGRLTCNEICKWIFESFRYFRDQTFDGCFSASSSNRYNKMDFDWMHIVKDQLQRYDSLVIKDPSANSQDGETFSIRPGLQTKALQASQPIFCDTTFPFLKLPPEIRNQIYRLVLVYPSTVLSLQVTMPNLSGIRTGRKEFRLQRCCYHWQPPWLPPQVVLSILNVNRQVYKEAMPIFYHENHFHVWSGSNLRSFLFGIGSERRSWLREMTIVFQNAGLGSAFTPLSECERLTALHIEIYLIQLHEENGGTIEDHKGLQKLSQIRGLTTLTCED